MDANGWHTISGDLFEFNGRCFLLVGDRGMGKTTLLANAIKLGATFISNERTFLKETDEGIKLRAFPQTIGVGMGTAMQLSELTHFIERPDHLRFIQQVFEPERVGTRRKTRSANCRTNCDFCRRNYPLRWAVRTRLPALR